MQFHIENLPVVNPVVDLVAAPPPPRVVLESSDVLEGTAGVRATYAADVIDRLAELPREAKVMARAFDVSLTSINVARRLTPEERLSVRQHKRSLVVTQPVSPERRLAALVDELGVAGVRELLALHEHVEAEVVAA
jgi:hypothetical protein